MESSYFNVIRYNYLSPAEGALYAVAASPHHGFTILLTENSKVLIEISVSTLVFTKVLTVFALKKLHQKSG